MYHLYPRLPLIVATNLARQYASQDLEQLRAQSSITHPAMYFAPTGGNQVSDQDMESLRKLLRDCALDHGYPASISANAARAFDIQCGIYLFEQLSLHASEASHLEMWAFFTTVFAPDLVRWRFGGEYTAIERFIGSDRGLRRNTFGRLWWRVYLLAEPQHNTPYQIFDWLVEDDLVQLTERNSIAAHIPLLREISSAFQHISEREEVVPRRLLMRESIKRIRRLASIVSFAALDRSMVQEIVIDVFQQTALLLGDNQD